MCPTWAPSCGRQAGPKITCRDLLLALPLNHSLDILKLCLVS